MLLPALLTAVSAVTPIAAHWNFHERAGATVARTAEGPYPAYVDARYRGVRFTGQSAAFDGQGRLDVPSMPEPGARDVRVSLRFRTRLPDANLIGYGNGNDPTYLKVELTGGGGAPGLQDGHPKCRFRGAAGQNLIRGDDAAPVNDGRWHVITCTKTHAGYGDVARRQVAARTPVRDRRARRLPRPVHHRREAGVWLDRPARCADRDARLGEREVRMSLPEDVRYGVPVGAIGVNRRESSWQHNVDAQLIKLGTLGRWSHAAIVTAVDPTSTRVRVTEAAGGGVRHRWIDALDPGWRFDRVPWITTPMRQTIAVEADRYLGWPYDHVDIARFVWRFWTGKVPRRKPGRPDYADDRVICSELVAWCMYVASQKHTEPRLDAWPTTAFGAVSPNDISDWMFTEEVRA